MLITRTPEAHAAALEKLKQILSKDQFYPPDTQGSIVFPGFDGGAEWGASAYHPETHLLYVKSNEMVWILRLVEQKLIGKESDRQEPVSELVRYLLPGQSDR